MVKQKSSLNRLKNTGSMSHRVNMSNITDNGNRMVVDDDLHTYAMVDNGVAGA